MIARKRRAITLARSTVSSADSGRKACESVISSRMQERVLVIEEVTPAFKAHNKGDMMRSGKFGFRHGARVQTQLWIPLLRIHPVQNLTMESARYVLLRHLLGSKIPARRNQNRNLIYMCVKQSDEELGRKKGPNSHCISVVWV